MALKDITASQLMENVHVNIILVAIFAVNALLDFSIFPNANVKN
jgi:hypothetical protein